MGMRFALDASALGRPTPSGIRTLLRELVPALAGALRGDDLLLWQNDVRAGRRPLPAPPGLALRSCRMPPRLLEALWRRLDWPPIEAFTGPLDVFHSIQGRLPAARRARLVLSLHDFRHRRLPHLYPTMRWSRREIARADHFIAVSETTRKDAMRFLEIPEERITRIYLGPPEAPPPIDLTAAARMLARFGLAGPYLFCPSSTDRRKNAAAAVEAFVLLKSGLDCPHRLAVVGGLPPSAEAAIRKRGGGEVVFTGLVSDADYQALLLGAESVVQPSLNEGFGLPVLEAFRAGVPQAVAGNSALPEVAGPGALTFDPEEPWSIAAAMERLIREPALRRELVEAGRRRLRDFSWETTAREMLALYRMLGARERSPVFRRAPAAIR
jgi:glycosyltransferase involved in cell wall biosynthesis